MRVCLIFRGENVREKHPNDTNRKYIDILMCWNNIQKTMIDDLRNQGHYCDIAFVTYPTVIIEEIQTKISPNYLLLHEQINQSTNFKDVVSFMRDHQQEYDRFVILRCDFRYRIPITKWPKWQENGIFLANKDVHWPTVKLYSDILFMVDSPELGVFSTAFEGSRGATIHGLGQYLYNHHHPFHLLYEDYYHMDKHPLHAFASIEQEEPDLDNPLVFEPIPDVSQWN
jgi:hypothetical protein